MAGHDLHLAEVDRLADECMERSRYRLVRYQVEHGNGLQVRAGKRPRARAQHDQEKHSGKRDLPAWTFVGQALFTARM
jgi:hypothetical protein